MDKVETEQELKDITWDGISRHMGRGSTTPCKRVGTGKVGHGLYNSSDYIIKAFLN